MPPGYLLLMWGLKALWVLFVFAYGACMGSLINVLVYRLPKGISVVTPPSRCPACNTRLTWRDNIPVLGWIFLRGRCRYCGVRISPEYPIVEAAVGLLFVLFYAAWYLTPQYGQAVFLGIDWAAFKPSWAHNDPKYTWPTFVLLMILLSSLVAMTIIDARTFTIPLELTWVPALAAVIIHPIHAAIVGVLPFAWTKQDLWAIPTPGLRGWGAIGASFGGVLGLGVGLLLLRFGLIRRSFADYAEWEQGVIASQAQAAASPDSPVPDPNLANQSLPSAPAAAPAALSTGEEASSAGIVLTPAPDGTPADLWIQYPHARREMIKELAFLGPCLLLAFAGYHAARWYAGLAAHSTPGLVGPSPAAPVWLVVLAAVLMGYLIGGGVVWGVRIFGSLAFGKEAMGLGDVHLMAAVGACLGWMTATLAFFGAAFVGLFWVILASIFKGGGVKRTMPYGPYLAVSTVLVLLAKPLIQAGLGKIFGHAVPLPP